MNLHILYRKDMKNVSQRETFSNPIVVGLYYIHLPMLSATSVEVRHSLNESGAMTMSMGFWGLFYKQRGKATHLFFE